MVGKQKDFESPEYWRGRASEAHAIADQMKDADARKTMLDIVKSYERLAERAERLKTFKKGSP